MAVLKIRERHAAGATVHKGAMGYGATQRMHPSGRLGLSRDLPVMITVVESEEMMKALLPLIDSMVTEGLIVLSDVDVVKYEHGSTFVRNASRVRPSAPASAASACAR